MIDFTEDELKLILYILNNYPRNMREPFETNGEFELHLNEVDSLINKIKVLVNT